MRVASVGVVRALGTEAAGSSSVAPGGRLLEGEEAMLGAASRWSRPRGPGFVVDTGAGLGRGTNPACPKRIAAVAGGAAYRRGGPRGAPAR